MLLTGSIGIRRFNFIRDLRSVFLTPNQEYLVPYRTLKLLYSTVHMSLLGFLLQLEQCPVKLLSGDDPTKAESCFRIFTISEIALRVPIPSCRRDFALLAHHGLERGYRSYVQLHIRCIMRRQ